MVGHTPLLDHGRSGVFTTREGFFTRLFASKPSRKAKQPAIYKGDMEVLPTLDKDDLDTDNAVAYPRFPGASANGRTEDGKSRPPARYDTIYPALGLYDDSDEKAGDLGEYAEPGRPLYDPVQYQQRSLAPGLLRNDSDPCFKSVPPYEPAIHKEERTPSLSGSTVYNNSIDGDGKSARAFSGKIESYGASPDLSVSGPLSTVFGIAKSVAFEDPKRSPTIAKLDTSRPIDRRIPSPTLSSGLRTSSPIQQTRPTALPSSHQRRKTRTSK